MKSRRQLREFETEKIPNSIRNASYLIYLSLVIGFYKAWHENYFNEKVSLLIGIFIFALLAVLAYLMGKGENWARITLILIFALGVVLESLLGIAEFGNSILSGSLTTLQTAVLIIVNVLLSSGDSNKWFRIERQ